MKTAEKLLVQAPGDPYSRISSITSSTRRPTLKAAGLHGRLQQEESVRAGEAELADFRPHGIAQIRTKQARMRQLRIRAERVEERGRQLGGLWQATGFGGF